jgi:hypothetical protein
MSFMRNMGGQNMGQMQQMQQMMQDQMRNRMQGMAPPVAPMGNYQSMMQTPSAPALQMQGYSGMNPMALAQMLRGLNRGAPIPQSNLPSMSGVSGMGRSFGIGLNPFLNRSPAGLKLNINRDAFSDFIKSISGE